MENDYVFEDLRVIAEIEELDELENQPPIRRVKIYKVRKNPFEELDEMDFKKKYRFLKSTAIYIIDLIKNSFSYDTRGGGIHPYLQILSAISSWARVQIQDDTGDLHGMSQPQVSLTCKKVALALVEKRAEFIKMPQGSQQNETISGFHDICGFRQVIGAIDCTHIRIPKIGGNSGQYYINRKGYSSLNVQVVCDAKLKIMDIVAHWRGSTHDSRIFNESRLKTRFESSEFRGRLLGDSGYACTPYLFTPVLNPTTEKEERYNYAQIRTRNTVERCFGVWKQRFRCLLKGFNNSLDNIKLYIIALAILHNIAIEQFDELEYTDEENDSEDDEITENNLPIVNYLRGNAVRAAFIEENF